ncbi:MAG TPA: pyridoxamine 5'-phosphate oxidase family protein [Accumulibacter sp.]|nr:pyridoxamine 5'-phosphate oxidase family protein [Accumulibacter sp.]HNE14111.1 pyridoxamine 5'-phosphate oxidase family protein [Accumulibacter sp.]HNL15206.1 pyridoxamine 5'-phosphate oxidase family protein [Accumulibacter sp.]HNL78648.1 pyridoxamine 5'-phosphate oxidase family protein [Accumulibacter sp.]HNO58830.1 pyridoxamine 5'-phosphate oxidase family protein [Accumulibacter sp.]
MNPILTAEMHASASQSVLCWLATVDAAGQPNVSPKEIFALLEDDFIAIANIASPGSIRNIGQSAKVCVSFVDVFVQKGVKVLGTASVITRADADYEQWAAPLQQKAGDRFPIRSVILIKALSAEAIVAPSYRFYPDQTTEQSQIQSAMQTYGVRPAVE